VKQKAIIVDLDGTLANIEHRRHHVTKKPPNWKAFNEDMIYDTINEWCKLLVMSFARSHQILFVTSRHEEYFGLTDAFLKINGLLEYDLFMRKDKDFRKDSIIKQEIYEQHIEPYFDVLFCIDDRQQVVDMWRSLGLVCLQCDVGDF